MKTGGEPIGRRIIAADADSRHTALAEAKLAEWRPPGWQQELAQAVRDPLELLDLLGLKPAQIGPGETAESLRAGAMDFPLRVPHSYIARMRHGDPADPLLRQVLSTGAERLQVAGYVTDPLQERDAREAPGLLHKYRGRALLIATGACAVHCRYCFRRHYDYGADLDDAGGARWAAALESVAQDPSLDEVILSGGDPLSLGNSRLAQLLLQLRDIPHLRRIRIHTRTPVVLPSRVDAGLLALLAPLRSRLAIVIHANHPAELDTTTAAALRQLAAHSAVVLNQSVLLAGVNDDEGTLVELSTRLFENGVLPYYLHQLDPVAGAAHYAVSDTRAMALHAAMAAALPGYLLPRLVRELPGATSKTALR